MFTDESMLRKNGKYVRSISMKCLVSIKTKGTCQMNEEVGKLMMMWKVKVEFMNEKGRSNMSSQVTENSKERTRVVFDSNWLINSTY